MYVPRDRYSLTMSFCVVPRSAADGDALLLGVGDVQGEQPRRRGVDRHRRVHLRRRDAVEQRAHVAEVDDRHADLADLAARPSASRGRSRSASAGRRRSTARSGPWPGSCGTARSTPPPSSARSTSASSTAASRSRHGVSVLAGRPWRPLVDRRRRGGRGTRARDSSTAPSERRCGVVHCTSSSVGAGVPQPLDEGDEGHLGGVGRGVEHRLAGEEAADAHAVEPADELAVVVVALERSAPSRAGAGARRPRRTAA